MGVESMKVDGDSLWLQHRVRLTEAIKRSQTGVQQAALLILMMRRSVNSLKVGLRVRTGVTQYFNIMSLSWYLSMMSLGVTRNYTNNTARVQHTHTGVAVTVFKLPVLFPFSSFSWDYFSSTTLVQSHFTPCPATQNSVALKEWYDIFLSTLPIISACLAAISTETIIMDASPAFWLMKTLAAVKVSLLSIKACLSVTLSCLFKCRSTPFDGTWYTKCTWNTTANKTHLALD